MTTIIRLIVLLALRVGACVGQGSGGASSLKTEQATQCSACAAPGRTARTRCPGRSVAYPETSHHSPGAATKVPPAGATERYSKC